MRTTRRIALTLLTVAITLGVGAGVASAQDGCQDPYGGECSPTSIERGSVPPEESPEVLSSTLSRGDTSAATNTSATTSGSALAVTGGDVAGLVGIGLAAIVAGAVLIGARRRQSATVA